MATGKLAKADWQSYFDRISKRLTGKRAEIEVTGLTLGDQFAAKWLPLIGITYDSKDDLLEIALEGLDHIIHKPRSVTVDDGPEGPRSMEIVDSDVLVFRSGSKSRELLLRSFHHIPADRFNCLVSLRSKIVPCFGFVERLCLFQAIPFGDGKARKSITRAAPLFEQGRPRTLH
jgi:hypothetical protein